MAGQRSAKGLHFGDDVPARWGWHRLNKLDSEEALEAVFAQLSEGGKIMMPLDDYGFSKRFGWLSDRFGVSWQLNLPNA